jgi:hypothetical protein
LVSHAIAVDDFASLLAAIPSFRGEREKPEVVGLKVEVARHGRPPAGGCRLEVGRWLCFHGKLDF